MVKKFFVFLLFLLCCSSVFALTSDSNQTLYNRSFEHLGNENLALLQSPSCFSLDSNVLKSGEWCAYHNADVIAIKRAKDSITDFIGLKSIFVVCPFGTTCETMIFAQTENVSNSTISFYVQGRASSFEAGYVNDYNVFTSVLSIDSGGKYFNELDWRQFHYVVPDLDNRVRIAFRINGLSNNMVATEIDDIVVEKGVVFYEDSSSYVSGVTFPADIYGANEGRPINESGDANQIFSYLIVSGLFILFLLLFFGLKSKRRSR